MSDLRSTVFVGNLSVFVSEQDIERLFSAYGTIVEIRMAKSEDRSKHLSYGFVKFINVASAQLAMYELNGALLCGRPLKVGKAFSRSNKKSLGSVPHTYDTASVHVTFISHQINRIVSEESLRHLFSQFGEVVDAVICKSNIDQDVGRQSGYGFIHFPGTNKGIESSFRAAEMLVDQMIDEINYKCKISHHLERQLLEVSPQSPPESPHVLSSSILPATTVASSVNGLQIYSHDLMSSRQHPAPSSNRHLLKNPSSLLQLPSTPNSFNEMQLHYEELPRESNHPQPIVSALSDQHHSSFINSSVMRNPLPIPQHLVSPNYQLGTFAAPVHPPPTINSAQYFSGLEYFDNLNSIGVVPVHNRNSRSRQQLLMNQHNHHHRYYANSRYPYGEQGNSIE